ncbi:hypothetical protein BH10PAT3_BH10PAT3_1330 [soil metagenome]
MDIRRTLRIAPGHYVAAISGGVDSVVLLNMLLDMPGIKLTVAHFDHGMRPDSHEDKLFVENLARASRLPFVYAEGRLGEGTSEEKARDARYKFLRKIQKQTSADGIITAHHMDDVLETATHNLLRGTGRKGMASLKSVDGILRPLLHLPKQHLIKYARANNLQWREDITNVDIRYRRNYIRNRILPRLREISPEKYERYKSLIKRQAELNRAIDTQLQTILHVQPSVDVLRRHDVTQLPHAVGREVVGEWLRQNGKREFSRKHLERATVALKTARPNTAMVLDKKYRIEFDERRARIVSI